MGDTLVSTKEYDYLDEDKPIKNQNYCLLSFISPEDVLVNKESYYLTAFFKNLSNDIKTLLDGIESKYPDDKEFIDTIRNNTKYLSDVKEMDEQYKFQKNINSESVEKLFHADNNFQTTMRGIKVRGVFETLNEAKNRSEFLKRTDKNHNIFIGQVGVWCPFSPNPDEISDQEYSETQLNTLMKEYKKNQETKDEIFENRKQTIINNTAALSSETDNDVEVVNKDMNNLNTVFETDDPWTEKNKNE